MVPRPLFALTVAAIILAWLMVAAVTASGSPFDPVSRLHASADHLAPSVASVKLIFIHHATGGHWLADPNDDQPYGGLGRALMNNGYYVSATNYGWGPGGIGDRTDIPNWPEWSTGPNSAAILAALYSETGQNFGDFGTWPRPATAPSGENQIVLFKSCFPNSDLYGRPDDLPLPAPNDKYTVANAKAVYNKILTYFAARQDKLFVVITAPPLLASETAPERVADARAFNNWLAHDWLAGYPYRNVAVFDYYNVLTSNGGDADTNDLGWQAGSHHRWWNGAVQHTRTVNNNTAAYPSGDSHPSTAGQLKATGEFVTLLNLFYNRWRAGGTAMATPAATATSGTPTAMPTRTVAARSPYLPLILKLWPSSATATPTPTPSPTPTATRTPTPTGTATQTAARLFQPADLVYLGAFRLPEGVERPRTFEYGGNAMTFRPNGDPTGPADGFPGSLFITGHDRLPYGELPDGSQVAEVNIPAPVNSRNLADLPVAAFLQNFRAVAAGHFTRMEEIVRIGMAYLDHPATGPKIHLAWGQHFEPDPPAATHAWFSPNLSSPAFRGEWFIGNQSFYAVNDYMFEIPAAWADAHAQGRYLATGRFRDGGWSGMGPALSAYRPWQNDGTPPASGTRLAERTLLRYESSLNTDAIERCLAGYQHPDEWSGGAWLTAGAKTAVLFAGTKSNGAKYWYGYVNPAGPDVPCVDGDVVGQFTTCRLANGAACPPEDLIECAGHNDYRGWWTTRWDAQFILYDPADLARVAAGQAAPWAPQPYAVLDVDDFLYLNPDGVELEMLGTGVQRRYRIGDVAYDRQHGRLYVLELFADGAKPVVHVWEVR